MLEEGARGLQGDTESAFTQFRFVESLNYGLGVQVERRGGQSQATVYRVAPAYAASIPAD